MNDEELIDLNQHLNEELTRVRGLLQRAYREIAESHGVPHSTVEARYMATSNLMAESADIGKLDRADKSGKVNKGTCPTCKRPAGYVIGSINESKVRRDNDDLTESKSSSVTYPGSAETEGEKAAPKMITRAEAAADCFRVEAREPEKLNNAHQCLNRSSYGANRRCSKVSQHSGKCVFPALAESSLSSKEKK